MAFMSWSLHGDGRTIAPDAAVAPRERLTWPRTIGIGAQHVLAMFGSTFVVPTITGFPPSTTLFFSAVGTVLFLIITGNRLPSYLGSSFAFLAPIMAATGSHSMGVALGGLVMVGLMLAIVGLVVHFAGTRWIEVTMPPVVTGAIVMLIGLNLAPAAWGMVSVSLTSALVSGLAVIVVTVLFKGVLGRLSILLGTAVGCVVAAFNGEYNLDKVKSAAWLGLPDFTAPQFDTSVIIMFLPVLFVLIAENIGHVKSVAAMTGDNLDPLTGRALLADGLATAVAGAGGGSGTTTYAENIGVMAATRVYSTAAYWFAAGFALLLSLSPKFGELIAATPAGVLGGLATVLFGMIAVLGARIWSQGNVDFGNPVNLMPVGIALIVGAANYTWEVGDLKFEGIVLGTAAALICYHLMAVITRWRSADNSVASPAFVEGDEDRELAEEK
ncbi:nitrate reductase [Demequina sp. B12]|uniref:uracil-xanthine permease family protein n=1 Tax=Demequina sp. B12 TaxID=2992757 RepID=UPI00237BA3CD|nr:solute carrier family 23 protein [Demequina sp. B12]MDE0573225.1 nitrate reductase [Demequina sp. B12]